MTVEVIDALERKLTDPALLESLGSIAVSRIQNRINRGSFAANAPLTQAIKGSSKPLRDRGNLLASIAYSIKLDRSGVVVGTNNPNASLLHNGGTVTPKHTRYLAIPAGNKTRQLMRTYGATPKACIEAMKAAGYNVWFETKAWSGQPMIFAQKKNGKTPLFGLFILKRSVEIPARPFMTLDGTDMQILRLEVQKRLQS